MSTQLRRPKGSLADIHLQQIISVHPDFTPSRHGLPVTTYPAVSPTKRHPLSAKISTLVPKPNTAASSAGKEDEAKTGKGSPIAVKPLPVHKHKANRPSKIVVQILKTSLPQGAESSKSRARLAGLTVSVPVKRGKPVPTAADEITKTLEKLKITPPVAPAVRKPQGTIKDLLPSCSSFSVHEFEGFFSSPLFLRAVFGASVAPSIRKLGEASYSEVFGVKVGKKEVVVKIIPLLDDVHPAEIAVPDCSEILDVKREIIMTRRMAKVPRGGFVEFLG
jgi:hypothetical protein